MRVLMVTPHLPPDQAANSLLPHYLGLALRERGHAASHLTFGSGPAGQELAYVKRRSPRLRATRLPQVLEAAETWWKGSPLLEQADVVHIHSNTWMNQVAARLATRRGRPYLVTHYGTEIWHHDGKDAAFRRLNREAHHVTFYSRALQDRARALEVPTRAASVVYPAVADAFRPLESAAREDVRGRFVSSGSLLLNVKRLHPLADQATLLDAMARVLERRQDVRLLIVGSGEEEKPLKTHAERLRLGDAVRFLGRVPNREVATLQGAADLFVLSSRLEATPTVALEALACGTPVVSTDNPGGVELHEVFGEDLGVVARQDPDALAQAVLAFLQRPRRASSRTKDIIAERFRLAGVVDRYIALYEEALGA